MGVQVADVEAPQHGPFDLRPALAAHLVEVGVVPDVGDRPGEPAVAVEEGGGLGDRAPAVQVVLGVQRQAHADVVTPEPRCRLACPGRRHEQRRGGGEPVPERVVHAGRRRVAEAQVGTVEDEEAVIGGCPDPLGHRRHAPTVVGDRSGGASRAGAEAGTGLGDAPTADLSGVLVEPPAGVGALVVRPLGDVGSRSGTATGPGAGSASSNGSGSCSPRVRVSSFVLMGAVCPKGVIRGP